MNVRKEWRTAERSRPAALLPLCSKIQKLNIMRQHIRILQRIAPRLPGQGFLDLKNVTIDARDLHRNIPQLQPRLPKRDVDADAGISLVTLGYALPNLLKLINFAHLAHAFYHKPA